MLPRTRQGSANMGVCISAVAFRKLHNASSTRTYNEHNTWIQTRQGLTAFFFDGTTLSGAAENPPYRPGNSLHAGPLMTQFHPATDSPPSIEAGNARSTVSGYAAVGDIAFVIPRRKRLVRCAAQRSAKDRCASAGRCRQNAVDGETLPRKPARRRPRAGSRLLRGSAVMDEFRSRFRCPPFAISRPSPDP